MFIQIRSYELKSGSAKDICKQAADGLGPVFRKIPGFVDYLNVDGQDGKVFSVTIFKDKSGLDEAQRLASDWSKKNAMEQLEKIEVFQGEILFEARLDQPLLKSAA